jgi:N utilization substance protein A
LAITRVHLLAKELGVNSKAIIDKLIALGIISVLDLAEIGADPLVKEIGITPEMAVKVIRLAEDLAKKQTAEVPTTIAQAILQEEIKEIEPEPKEESPQ